MLCYAMLCHAMLCHARLCHATRCCAMICYAVPCYAMLCHTTRCCASTYYHGWFSGEFLLFFRCFYGDFQLRDAVPCYAMIIIAMLGYGMLWYGMACAVLCYAMVGYDADPCTYSMHAHSMIFRWISGVFQVFFWWFSATRCCVMPCYAMLCHAMLC